MTNDILDFLDRDLSQVNKKRRGRNPDKKNYHKVTISITQKNKQELMDYADNLDISVSKLIKDLLISNKIIS